LPKPAWISDRQGPEAWNPEVFKQMPSENIDTREIRYFEHHGADWWERGGSLKALHDINPLRLGYVADRAALAGRAVLDVGCGGGILSEALARSGARVTGIDQAVSALSAARSHRDDAGLDIDYRRATAEALAGEMRARFDVIVCMELLEHVLHGHFIVGPGHAGSSGSLQCVGAGGVELSEQGFDVHGDHRSYPFG